MIRVFTLNFFLWNCWFLVLVSITEMSWKSCNEFLTELSGSEDEGLGFSKPSLSALFSLALEADWQTCTKMAWSTQLWLFPLSDGGHHVERPTIILQSRPKNEAFEDQISSWCWQVTAGTEEKQRLFRGMELNPGRWFSSPFTAAVSDHMFGLPAGPMGYSLYNFWDTFP